MRHSIEQESTTPEQAALSAWNEYKATGSEQAYTEFQRLMYPMLLRLCGKRQLFRFVAEPDAIQEIFIKIWKAMKLFDPARGRLYSFICNVANNRISTLQQRSAIDSSRWHYVHIDDRENAEGASECQGMKALNKLALEAWKHGESTSMAPSVHDDEDLPALPDNERDAIRWLLETLAVDSAAESSAHHISELEAKFSIPAERGRDCFSRP